MNPIWFPDPILILMAKSCRADVAREANGELMRRLDRWMIAQITKLAEPWHLQQADLDDALQIRFFALEQTIRSFSVDPLAEGTCRLFRALLRKIMHDRFLNHVKYAAAFEKHYDHTKKGEHALDASANKHRGTAGRLGLALDDDDDPAAVAEKDELLAALHKALGQLTEDERMLLELKRSLKEWKPIARALHIGVSTARWRWNSLLAKLRVMMQPFLQWQ